MPGWLRRHSRPGKIKINSGKFSEKFTVFIQQEIFFLCIDRGKPQRGPCLDGTALGQNTARRSPTRIPGRLHGPQGPGARVFEVI